MEQIEALLVNIREKIGSLERQMQKGFDGLNARFDTLALRLDRQAALMQTGFRWNARMNERSEEVNPDLEAEYQEIADLTERIRKLEQN